MDASKTAEASIYAGERASIFYKLDVTAIFTKIRTISWASVA